MKTFLRWTLRLLVGAVAVAVVLLLVASLFLRKVTSDDMAPTLLPGDYVWIVPVTPTRGDIVRIPDPNDPEQYVLRRIVADPEQKVRFDENGLRVNGKRVRQQDPVAVDGVVTTKETIWSKPPARASSWFIWRADRDATWKTEPYEVPANHWYVLADNREWALDSRWWGAVDASAVTGVVRLRIGPSDELGAKKDEPHRGPVTWMKGVPVD
jgi:signal peptidase I